MSTQWACINLPHAILVRVGSSDAKPYYWHDIKLADLGARLVALDGSGNTVTDDQVIPILV